MADSAVPSPAPAPQRFLGVPSRRANVAAWACIAAVSAASLHFFFVRHLTLRLGDTFAHMEGARRIFDSLTPGYPEIGSTWLPLLHLLASPLAQNDYLWRTGLAGSLISVAAFAVTAYFLFRLGFEMGRNYAAAAVALAGVLLCPNLLYLASAPLTEPLMLMWSVLTVYGLFRFQSAGRRSALAGAAISGFFGTLTRYDGWFLLPFAALFVLLAQREPWRVRARNALLFLLIAGMGPLLWILHNAFRFGNPLDFYNGPFSARAIYAHQIATTGFRYPTDGKPLLSLRYYLEDLRLVIGPGPLELAVLGLVAWAVDRSSRARSSAALLFLVPLPFYVQAMAHAAVPMYLPTLFPHTYYNVRYGIEMLPAVALLPSFVLTRRLTPRIRNGLLVIFLIVLVGQGIQFARGGATNLVCVKESILNDPCQRERQAVVVEFFREHYDGQRLLMALGKWPCVAPEVGIPYRRILTEANRRYWIRLSTVPGKWVEWIVTTDSDTVTQLMRAHPRAFASFRKAGEWKLEKGDVVTIYRKR